MPAGRTNRPTPTLASRACVLESVHENLKIKGRDLAEGCEALSGLVNEVKPGDESLLHAGVCELLSDILCFWGQKDRDTALCGCLMARRLAECGSAYVARLNRVGVAEGAVNAIDGYGSSSLKMAHAGCALFVILSPGWSESRKEFMRAVNVPWALSVVVENEFKKRAISVLTP
jgi:hypothetical protein